MTVCNGCVRYGLHHLVKIVRYRLNKKEANLVGQMTVCNGYVRYGLHYLVKTDRYRLNKKRTWPCVFYEKDMCWHNNDGPISCSHCGHVCGDV